MSIRSSFSRLTLAVAALVFAPAALAQPPINPAKVKRTPTITRDMAVKPQGPGATISGCAKAAKDMTPAVIGLALAVATAVLHAL